ncbi:MAG: peptidoglycan DD-metalloendopeptidase family protein [Actinomycetota bacterium]|nr:peptidoglycan DD-metalloendopeptidase family protein [Actinomycetota bacterium]
MVSHRVSRGFLLLLIVALLAIVPIGASAQTEGDVDRAESRVGQAQDNTSQSYARWQQAQDDLEAAILELDIVTSRLENLVYTIGLTESRIVTYEETVDTLKENAQQLFLEAYTSGGRGMVAAAFEAVSIQDLLTSQQLMNNAASRDLADLDRYQAVSREMDRLKTELVEKQAEVEAVEAETAAVAEKASTLSEQARSLYNQASAAEKQAIDNLAKERRELQAAIALKKARDVAAANSKSGTAAGLPPTATPGFYCPVQGGASFIDSWGFPRSGGRRHKGVDMFNSRNTPLIAVVDGRIKFSSNSLGGRSTHLYAADGTVYYYTHLEAHPSNISSGQNVKAGTVVGYLGNSGNARYTSPHLHFEIRPGGVAVNPYPTVRHYCP